MPTDDERHQAAGFFQFFIRLLKEHQEAVAHATFVSAAMLQALAEKHPEILDAYQRHLAAIEKSSPAAGQLQQALARLDELAAQWKG